MTRRVDSYDDDLELTDYIWHNYAHLRTDLETRAGNAAIAERKAQAASGQIANVLRNKWGIASDPRFAELLKDGLDEFRRRVRDRILADSADEVVINRCARCQCIVATPRAQQCLWCGHNWH